MSYLDLPRVHLFGQFYATPSTINNLPENYDPRVPLTNGNPNTPGAVSWNPRGQALWKMDVGVQSALGADGAPVAADPLLGARLTSVPAPNHAKLVDLDPDQQVVSQVWGLEVKLTLADGTVAFTGSVDPCALQDIWFTRVVNTKSGGNPYASGAFQSAVRVRWGDTGSSPLLQALRRASPDRLSIKWVVDAYSTSSGTAGFGYGRMVATLGPQGDAEPAHVVMGRRLEVPPGVPLNPRTQLPDTLLWFAVARLEGQRLTLDLGNAVAVDATPGGPPLAFPGPITVAAVSAVGAPVTLGTVDYTLQAYQSRAGIFDLPLTPAQAAAAAGAPLRAWAPVPTDVPLVEGYTAVVAERPDGLYVDADQSFTRLDPGQADTRIVYASRFGKPATVTVSLQVQAGQAGPPDGLVYPKTVQVQNGAAKITVTGGRIGEPRGRSLDGQVYLLSPATWSQNLAAPMLSALVFSDAFRPARPPTWADVGPILAGFARLYPGMRDILDLSDYGTMKASAGRLRQVLSLPLTDPNYMPVTRDLSTAKRQAILDWIAAGCPPAPTTPAAAVDAVPAADTVDAGLRAGAEPAFESAAPEPAGAAPALKGQPPLPNDYHQA